ncbi:unnamed protein product, partial [Urochloa humidicola]
HRVKATTSANEGQGSVQTEVKNLSDGAAGRRPSAGVPMRCVQARRQRGPARAARERLQVREFLCAAVARQRRRARRRGA